MLAGVAGGLARRFGVDALLVRVVFVALALAGATGVLIYVALWIATDAGDDAHAPDAVATTDPRRAVAVVLVASGVLLLLRNAGLWLGHGLLWPLAAAGIGGALLWSRSGTGRGHGARVVAGALLLLAGLASLLATNVRLVALGGVLLAIVATAVGAGLILGPWTLRLVTQLRDERRERIRQEERAEVAAHLHDSVLQTLALIQRSADQPRRMVTLARQQERELRAWLYGRLEPSGAGDLRSALQALVAEIEDAHDVAIELVTVGALPPLDDRTRALLGATREALVNAAVHSGVPEVTLFVERADDRVEVFVRDRGRGFDPACVDPDRHGISRSIVDRMRRHGGRAEVSSSAAEGTEVALCLPLERSRT